MPELLAVSKNNQSVFVDVENTNVKLHLLEYPNILELVKIVAQNSVLEGANVGIEYDMGEVVGKTSCVQTTDSDEIVYAKRLQRDSYSRFVKGRELEDTHFVSAVFFQKDYGYLLWSAWCGNLVPTSPDAEGRMRTSVGFWANHALVYDAALIQQGTERSEPPIVKSV